MKKFLFFTLLAAVAALSSTAGCKKGDGSSTHAFGGPDTIFVKMGETVQIPGDSFSIRLDSVLSDYRCPSTVDCLLSGAAFARFVFTKNGSSVLDTLRDGSFEVEYLLPDSTSQFGRKVFFLELSPYPMTPTPIPQGEYGAKLLVQPE